MFLRCIFISFSGRVVIHSFNGVLFPFSLDAWEMPLPSPQRRRAEEREGMTKSV